MTSSFKSIVQGVIIGLVMIATLAIAVFMTSLADVIPDPERAYEAGTCGLAFLLLFCTLFFALKFGPDLRRNRPAMIFLLLALLAFWEMVGTKVRTDGSANLPTIRSLFVG